MGWYYLLTFIAGAIFGGAVTYQIFCKTANNSQVENHLLLLNTGGVDILFFNFLKIFLNFSKIFLQNLLTCVRTSDSIKLGERNGA